MSKNIMLPVVLAAALMVPAALAQAAPPPGGPGQNAGPMGGKAISREDMQKHHAQMCMGFYAHEVGALAETEARLQLTAKQKPLFDKWKAVKLSSAKVMSDACAAQKGPEMQPPAGKDAAAAKPPMPNPAEAMKHELSGLQDKVAALKSELPVFEALVASLTDDQKMALQPSHHGKPGGHDGPGAGPHGGAGGPGAGPNGGPGPEGCGPQSGGPAAH